MGSKPTTSPPADQEGDDRTLVVRKVRNITKTYTDFQKKKKKKKKKTANAIEMNSNVFILFN